MKPSQLIAFLNAMTCGDLESISAKLEEARAACQALGAAELSLKIVEAREALLEGDLRTYRKRVETVVAGLGHLKSRDSSESGVGTSG